MFQALRALLRLSMSLIEAVLTAATGPQHSSKTSSALQGLRMLKSFYIPAATMLLLIITASKVGVFGTSESMTCCD